MFCTEIVSDIQKTFCTQCVLPMFCKKKSFWQRFTCTDFIKKASVALKLITGFIVFAVVLTAGAVSKGALLFMVAQVKWNEILKIQSITCNVWLQLAEMRCVITSCDVLVEPMLVVTCNVRACGAFSGLRSTTAILHICGNNKRDFFWCTVFPQIVSVLEELWPKVIVHKAKLKKKNSFCGNYRWKCGKLQFCSSKLEDFNNFSQKKNICWEIAMKVLWFKTMFKS